MKRIKLITLLALFVTISFYSFGQLSERVNSNSSFKYGTRPVQGNFGFYIGANIQDVKDLGNRWKLRDSDTARIKNLLPLVLLRYYISDNDVLRFGINSKRQNIRIAGDLFKPATQGDITELKVQRTSSLFFINPGIEHHFLKSNIADVYLGASIPVGYVTEKQTDYVKATVDYSSSIMSRKALSYGFQGFMGIQAFIADLPMSIGLEIGVAALVENGKKWKVEYKQVVGGVPSSETYYAVNLDPEDRINPSTSLPVITSAYDRLSAKTSSIDGMARLTICYYFAN